MEDRNSGHEHRHISRTKKGTLKSKDELVRPEIGEGVAMRSEKLWPFTLLALASIFPIACRQGEPSNYWAEVWARMDKRSRVGYATGYTQGVVIGHAKGCNIAAEIINSKTNAELATEVDIACEAEVPRFSKSAEYYAAQMTAYYERFPSESMSRL
jgi:hypothetical protein